MREDVQLVSMTGSKDELNQTKKKPLPHIIDRKSESFGMLLNTGKPGESNETFH